MVRSQTMARWMCALLAGFALAAALAAAPVTPPASAPPRPAPPTAEAPKLEFVLMTTSKGEVVIELNRAKAPVTVANFLAYVDKKHYDNTIFHRIMSHFMIQGGGYTVENQLKPTDPPIRLESTNGLSNVEGTIAMARTGQPNSATCQFFINTADNRRMLDAAGPNTGYAVFGRVAAGMSVVNAIKQTPVTTAPGSREQSRPTELVSITHITRLTPEDAQKRIDAEKSASASPR